MRHLSYRLVLYFLEFDRLIRFLRLAFGSGSTDPESRPALHFLFQNCIPICFQYPRSGHQSHLI